MLDARIGRNSPAVVADSHTVQAAVGPLAVQTAVIFVAGSSVEQGHTVDHCPAVALLTQIDRRDPARALRRFLQIVIVEPGSLAKEDLDRLQGQQIDIVGLRVVADQQTGLGIGAKDHQDASHSHHGLGRRQNIDQLQRLAQRHAPGHVDQQTVANQHRVERHNGIVHVGGLSVILG